MAVTKAVAKKLKGLLGDSMEARLKRAREMGFDTDTVYYHGTSKDLSEINPDLGQYKTKGTGSFFTNNPEVAASYSGNEGANIIPVYIKKGNALEIDAGSSNWNSIPLDTKITLPARKKTNTESANLLSELTGEKVAAETIDVPERVTTIGDALGIDRLFGDYVSTDDLARFARNEGYDSLKISNVIDRGPYGKHITDTAMSGKPSDLLVSFDGSDARSVNAMFDPAKKDSSNLMAGMAGAAPIAGLGLLGLGSDQAYAGSVLPPNTPNVGQKIEAPVNPKTEMAAGLLGGLNRRLENRGLGLLAPEGLENYLRKAAYGDEVTYLDRLFAALDVAP